MTWSIHFISNAMKYIILVVNVYHKLLIWSIGDNIINDSLHKLSISGGTAFIWKLQWLLTASHWFCKTGPQGVLLHLARSPNMFSWGPFYRHDFTLIPTWISNHMFSKVWDENTYTYTNFNSLIVEVLEWISNFIPHFMMDVITYPCWEWRQPLLIKGSRYRISQIETTFLILCFSLSFWVRN